MNDIAVELLSAAGDPQGLTNLVQTVARREDVTVIYSLGTQASQAVFSAVKEKGKPVVFGAVTDPVAAGFFEGVLTKPKGNITGTQDLWPYAAQFELLQALLPKARRIGVVYNSSEVNSQVSVARIKEQAEKRGLVIVERTVTDEAQILPAVAGLLHDKIGAFYIPADNTAQTSASVIIATCSKESVPVFTGIDGIVEKGAVGTVGTNYYELGKVNARQVAAIIKEGKKASDIPVQIAEKGDVYLNVDAAKRLDISIPEEWRKRAVKIFEKAP